jgi:hypothetical protein
MALLETDPLTAWWSMWQLAQVIELVTLCGGSLVVVCARA